jgi:hypothetical protein
MTDMGNALLPEFLEEHLWALRDRADALSSVPLAEPAAVKLGVVTDELADIALLLRRPTRTNREGVAVLLEQMRRMLESIEAEAWPTRASAAVGTPRAAAVRR